LEETSVLEYVKFISLASFQRKKGRIDLIFQKEACMHLVEVLDKKNPSEKDVHACSHLLRSRQQLTNINKETIQT